MVALEADLAVPMKVVVAFIGLEDLVDKDIVERTLQTLLPSVQPVLIDKAERLGLAVRLEYLAAHLAEAHRDDLERAVGNELEAGSVGELHTVEASRLEPIYAGLMDKAAAFLGSRGPPQPARVVFIQRLRTAEVARAAGADDGLRYAYRYDGSAPSQSFVGRGRYCVVDLSSRPGVALGRIGEEEGAVSSSTFPRPELGGSEGEVAALVVSAVRQVFVPSVRTCPEPEALHLPTRFAAHVRVVHESADERALAIRAEEVRHALQSLVLPGQQVDVDVSFRTLAGEVAIALALERARATATALQVGHGRYRLVTSLFVDGAELLAALRPAVAGAPGADEYGSVQEATAVLLLLDDDDDAPALIRTPPLVADAEEYGTTRAALAWEPTLRSTGEMGALVTEHGLAVALLSAKQAGDARRHVVAGLASALLGLQPVPAAHFSEARGRALPSHLWSVGAHPFGAFRPRSARPLCRRHRRGACPCAGPFAKSAALSQALEDAARMAQVLCAHHHVRSLVAEAGAKVRPLAAAPAVGLAPPSPAAPGPTLGTPAGGCCCLRLFARRRPPPRRVGGGLGGAPQRLCSARVGHAVLAQPVRRPRPRPQTPGGGRRLPRPGCHG